MINLIVGLGVFILGIGAFICVLYALGHIYSWIFTPVDENMDFTDYELQGLLFLGLLGITSMLLWLCYEIGKDIIHCS